MDRQIFMSILYAKVQAFETHWNRCQRSDPGNYPNQMNDSDWWEQWEAFCEVYDDSDLGTPNELEGE